MKPFLLATLAAGILLCSPAFAHYGSHPGYREVPGRSAVYEITLGLLHLNASDDFINGPVKRVSFADSGNANGKFTLLDSGYSDYDRSGRLLFKRIYSVPGHDTVDRTLVYAGDRLLYTTYRDALRPKDNERTTYLYDSKGRLTRTETMTTYPTNKTDTLARLYTYTYNAAGHITQQQEYWNGKLRTTYNYQYDKSGRPTETIEASPGFKPNRLTYTYDKTGNKITTCYTAGSKWVKTNDKTGRETGCVIYSPNGSVLTNIAYQSDDHNNMINDTIRDKRGYFLQSSEYYNYQYDEQGNITCYHNYLPDPGTRIIMKTATMTYTYW